MVQEEHGPGVKFVRFRKGAFVAFGNVALDRHVSALPQELLNGPLDDGTVGPVPETGPEGELVARESDERELQLRLLVAIQMLK